MQLIHKSKTVNDGKVDVLTSPDSSGYIVRLSYSVPSPVYGKYYRTEKEYRYSTMENANKRFSGLVRDLEK